jgi:hypothetical protein
MMTSDDLDTTEGDDQMFNLENDGKHNTSFDQKLNINNGN